MTILDSIERNLAWLSSSICSEMQHNLDTHGHVDTWNLYNSIRHEEHREGNKVISYIYADAQNPQNGAYYAEFIEKGTGAAHGRAGGRVGSWRYKDRNGVWHTTDGMDADPFIMPAVDNHKDELDHLADNLMEPLMHDIHEEIAKYWKLKGGSRP